MPWLFNVAYAVVIAAAMPVLIYRRVRHGKYRAGWREKLFGAVPELPTAGERVWFHAVSVGEVLLLKSVIAELRSRRPDVDLIMTATTETGFDVARSQYPGLTVCYCPLDFSWAVRRAIERLKPTALVLAELELWPNLVRTASQQGVRLAIVNGRLGEKSFRGYSKLRPLIAALLSRFDAIAVQSDEYASRFLALGAPAERLIVTGSVKFDGVTTDRNDPRTQELCRWFGIDSNEPVFIAGSTQHPEEEIALDTWQELQREFPALRLILVPRHKERFEEVARLVERRGLSLTRRSQSTAANVVFSRDQRERSARNPPPVCLLDTLGELSACWGLANVAFVGGSLTHRGGQNMIEPAACGAAVLFGPNTWNFRDVVRLLLSHDAAKVVGDRRELTDVVRTLLADEDLRLAMGTRGREAVAAHRGATARTVDLLLAHVLKPQGNSTQRDAA